MIQEKWLLPPLICPELVDKVLDKTGMKGTSKWTIQQAANLSVAAPTIASSLDARFCYSDCLDRKLVEGKILFYNGSSNGQEAINVSAVGSIMEEELMNDLKMVYALPAILFGLDREQIKHYINTTK
ncbi:6-phosphogluconate dehydrogenase, decarboxylating 2, chloroplastic [Cinnamomum micranthum f. kanehirae]|uniref:phosphogluconate dehydrogenase (NADP(+)-dependent, decarboxylating) n=1 Tax=Cinnamomum micranthum f. kanehirae TaxID=337451 RepID=A0A3S3MAP9_9MAGN|nr:6-phosphogluconate dehydrogenase, decarboxylating 2, chloroplastic [Cinnamomum micranthum f. kanehirae]